MSRTPPADGAAPRDELGDVPGGEPGFSGGERDPNGGGAEGEPELAGGEAAAGEAPKKAEEDPDLVLLHAETPVPSLDELRAALGWAFEKEDIPASALDLYARHAHLVLEGNRRMNLTAIVDPREVAAKHYLDSWRATRLLPLLGRSVLDIGTGAGFPGMPVALAEPQARVVMLDSTKK